ncbi:putative kinetochore protein spc24 [Coniosporium apollinis]|uniref:Kinetochore protein Spc24 n=2 Tax=Coniosporium TaxID=2810619 RepID=A0ABQ9NHB7_9PEZI|nr:putative kinetochore protein spc24 [Cladosporium sp. JES 115]KAJ9657536.1 putative kinetochore protein spc24 [Coniosporium apollinis]
MLLDEDPAALIASCAANFNIAPDRASLTRISSSLSSLQQFRQHNLSQLSSTLAQFSRQLSNLQSQHSLIVSSHNAADHASEILRLDTEKFRIAKQASEAEIEVERLEAELDGLRGQLGDMEAQGVENAAEAQRSAGLAEDEVLLKLKVYRSLGIDVEQDQGTGRYSKAVIRNTQKGDVHVVNIDPKFSQFFYASWFWQTM